jgi:hypothetical protein
MQSLENRVRANLKCHFGGLAIVVPDAQVVVSGEPATAQNPKAPVFDVEVAKKAAYGAIAELVQDKYGTGAPSQPGTQQPGTNTATATSSLLKARQKVLDTLKSSPEVSEAGDLYPGNRYAGSVASGAFAPIFFAYAPTEMTEPLQGESKKGAARKFYFVYNGRFLIIAAFSGPEVSIPALSETVSEVCLLMSRSGYEFRWMPPNPTKQSVDLGGVSAASAPLGAVLNDSVGQVGTTTRMFMETQRGVSDSLRSIYAASFQSMMMFYSLKEESDTRDALITTIEAHRGTVLDLVHEFNQARGRQFFRRRKLRKLVRAHCLNLTEKIGRVEVISDSIAQGISSLDNNLQQDSRMRSMFEGETNWKSYLRNDFDERPVLEMVSRTSDEVSRPDMGFVVFWVALLAAVTGAVVGSIISGLL